jgi:hypothetical protein
VNMSLLHTELATIPVRKIENSFLVNSRQNRTRSRGGNTQKRDDNREPFPKVDLGAYNDSV